MMKHQTEMTLHVSPPVALIQTPSVPTISCDLTSFVSAPGASLPEMPGDTESRSSENQPSLDVSLKSE